MADIRHVAKHGTFDEFVQAYDPAHDDTADALHAALGNGDLEARVAIAERLLDDGADPLTLVGSEKFSTLHVLLAQSFHDVDAEVPLLRRLLDGGADVNAVAEGWGTPLQTLASVRKFSDSTLAPFYDVFFSRPDLDLLKPGKAGRSTLESARRSAKRAELATRMEQYLTDRGIAVPEREV